MKKKNKQQIPDIPGVPDPPDIPNRPWDPDDDDDEDDEYKDRCVLCKCVTKYSIDTPVQCRTCYIQGAGQLCKECYKKVYDK